MCLETSTVALPFDGSQPLTVAAIGLLRHELHGKELTTAPFGSDEDVQAYLSVSTNASYNYYGLVGVSGLVAAASVLHGVPVRRRDLDTCETWIQNIAVQPICRKQGYGRQLMRDVAIFAQSYGDTVVELYGLQQAADFYSKLGFDGAVPSISADVASLVALPVALRDNA